MILIEEIQEETTAARSWSLTCFWQVLSFMYHEQNQEQFQSLGTKMWRRVRGTAPTNSVFMTTIDLKVYGTGDIACQSTDEYWPYRIQGLMILNVWLGYSTTVYH